MHLHAAEFCFGNHKKVVFINGLVVAYEDIGRGGWEIIGKMNNPWASSGREKEGVMGRQYKPRVSDAKRCLGKIQRKGTPAAKSQAHG